MQVSVYMHSPPIVKSPLLETILGQASSRVGRLLTTYLKCSHFVTADDESVAVSAVLQRLGQSISCIEAMRPVRVVVLGPSL